MSKMARKRHKLALRRRDQATLQAVLDESNCRPEFSHTREGELHYFRAVEDADPELVYRGIGRLVVVDVSLERGLDDAQLIFESLNSTGVALSQSDLIRNFILMRLPEAAQTRLYDRYWSRVEQLFRGSESTFDGFIRDFLALATKATKQERANEIYAAFRREFGAIGHDESSLEQFLAGMLRSAGYHAAFSTGSSAAPSLRGPLARLRHLVDVPAILVMRLFECHLESLSLTEAEFVEALTLIESYIFRRAVCGEQTRGYWQVFANIAYQLDSGRPLESLRVGLARQHDSYRFPNDEEFRSALEDRDVYGKRICFDLLERLENADTNEPSDTSKYSIEHILPQNPNLIPEWREMLGDEWREVQRVWLHRLGNLTLTGYNSKYSDRPFNDKKVIKDGFCDSAVRLNRFVRDQNKWTPIEMEERGRSLAQRALEIWPRLNADQRLVDAASESEMRALARRRDVAKVKMDATARQLFESLRTEVRKLDDEVIELAEQHSVSYHAPGFFMEVLPRTQWLNLLES